VKSLKRKVVLISKKRRERAYEGREKGGRQRGAEKEENRGSN